MPNPAPALGSRKQPGEHADHEDVGMRKVDHPQHGEGQRKADRHHRIGAADDEAVGELLQQKVHVASPRISGVSPPRNTACTLSLRGDLVGQPALDDAADLKQVSPMRDLQRLARVLLDHQDGDAHRVDLAHQT